MPQLLQDRHKRSFSDFLWSSEWERSEPDSVEQIWHSYWVGEELQAIEHRKRRPMSQLWPENKDTWTRNSIIELFNDYKYCNNDNNNGDVDDDDDDDDDEI